MIVSNHKFTSPLSSIGSDVDGSIIHNNRE
jgi:hypothetical protein